jgi:hypothetical protein
MTIDLNHVKNAANRLNTALLVGHQKLSAGKAFEAWLMLVLLKVFSGTWMSRTTTNDILIRLNGGKIGGTQNKAGYGAFSHLNSNQLQPADYEIHNSIRAEGYSAQGQPAYCPRHELDLVIIPATTGTQSRAVVAGQYLKKPDIRVFLELKDYTATAGIAAARQVCFNMMDIAGANPIAGVNPSPRPPPTGILVTANRITQPAINLLVSYQCKYEELVASGQLPPSGRVDPNPKTNPRLQNLQTLISNCL